MPRKREPPFWKWVRERFKGIPSWFGDPYNREGLIYFSLCLTGIIMAISPIAFFMSNQPEYTPFFLPLLPIGILITLYAFWRLDTW